MSRSIVGVACNRCVLLLVSFLLMGCTAARVPATAAVAVPALAMREQPPAPGAPRELTIPAPVQKQLANGLRVVVLPRHGARLVTIELRVALAGSMADPSDRFGLAEFAASLLSSGTQTRTAPQIAAEAEALGSSVDASASRDASRIGMTVITPKVPEAIALLADLVQHPTFAAAEVERHRAQAVDGLRVAMSDPGDLGALVVPQLGYDFERYRHATGGTLASLGRIQTDDLRTFHRKRYRPDRSVLILAGDIDADAAFATAERSFGQWCCPSKSSYVLRNEIPPSNAGRVVVIDLPGSGQAAVFAMYTLPRRASPDYYAGMVTNAVLGGGYSSRLNAEIRIKSGLSYGAFSKFDALLSGGSLLASAQTKNVSANQVLALMKAEIERLSAERVPAAELDVRRANLLGEFARSLETSEGLADRLGEYFELGLTVDEINRVAPMVTAVTAEQVQSFAAENLGKADISFVVVGDAKLFVDELRQRYPTLELIPASELDLDSPTLRRAGVK